MALDFPSNPSLNEIYTYEGRSWTWNSFAWKSISNATPKITDLLDVDTSTTSPQQGNALIWDDDAEKWTPGEPGASALGELTNVDLVESTLDNNDVLTYDIAAGKWVNKPAPAGTGGGGGVPGGSDQEIQYNDNGSFAGSTSLKWDESVKKLTVGGDLYLNGGTNSQFDTIFQTVTPTETRVITFPDNTGVVALVSGMNGQVMYNNLGKLDGGNLFYSVSDGVFGYGLGRGSIDQSINKSTGVTLNAPCGQIKMNGATLAANTTVTFILTNSSIKAGDVLILNHLSGGTAGAYTLNAQTVDGSANINVRNIIASNLSEEIVINFAIIKS